MLILAAGLGWRYWTHWRYFQSTNDAYLQSDMVQISPRVTGYLVELRVTDNQVVRRGDLLFRLDDREYRAAAEQAQADVKGSRAQVDSLDAQLAQQQTAIGQAQLQVGSDEAQAYLGGKSPHAIDPSTRRLLGELQTQVRLNADTMAYADCFFLMAMFLFMCITVLVIVPKPSIGAGAAAH